MKHPSTRARWQLSLAIAVCAALSCLTTRLLADEPTRQPDAASPVPMLKSRGCPQIDPESLKRALALEVQVAGISADVARLVLSVACGPNVTELRAIDPLRGTQLRRQLPAVSVSDPSRERTIALAAVELIEALPWTEAGAETERSEIQLQPPSTKKGRAFETPHQRMRFEATFGLGVKWRTLERPLRLTLAELGARWLAKRSFSLGAGGVVEGATVSRNAGTVTVRAFGAFLDASFQVAEGGPLAFDGEARVSPVLVTLDGSPRTSDFVRGEAQGWALDAGLGLGTTLDLNALNLRLSARSGISLPRAEAAVEGEESVRFGGWWSDLALRAGIQW